MSNDPATTALGSVALAARVQRTSVAVIIDVGEHRAEDPARDVYRRLYEALAVDPPSEPRYKPPCCDEAGPPVDDAQLEKIESGYRALTRRRRRR